MKITKFGSVYLTRVERESIVKITIAMLLFSLVCVISALVLI